MAFGFDRISPVLLLTGLIAACSGHQGGSRLDIEPLPPSFPPGHDSRALQRLSRTMQMFPGEEHRINDVRLILQARDFESREQHDRALRTWRQAFLASRGKVAPVAFEGWVTSLRRFLGRQASDGKVASLILQDGGAARQSWLTTKKLNSQAALVEWLGEKMPVGKEGARVSPAGPPAKPGIPVGDRRLKKALKDFCTIGGGAEKAWSRWLGTLPPGGLAYMRAGLARCLEDLPRAALLFGRAAAKLERRRVTASLAVAAREHQVSLYRRLGERTKAAEAFTRLVEAFRQPGVSANSYGVSEMDFRLRRINAALWAGRYRALVGDYLQGAAHVREAFELISKAWLLKESAREEHRKQLVEYRAEGYQILAFRIAIEKGDYDAALNLNRLGLEVPGLSEEWQDRFHWYSGLYLYRSGRAAAALETWENLLEESEDRVRPRLHFWLAKSLAELGRRDESNEHITALLQEDPLGFYAVIGLKAAGLPGSVEWREVLGEPGDLRARLKGQSGLDIDGILDHEILSGLMIRAEIAAIAGLGDLSRLLARELYDHAGFSLDREGHRSEFLYLSRLLHQVSAWNHAITLTGRVAAEGREFWLEHPEQVYIYFPMAMQDVFVRNANRTRLEPALLLAVTRQESAFRARVESPAGAIGLMQLIPTTAERYARREGVGTASLNRRLKEPDLNIFLGSSYLKELSRLYKGDVALMAAAYNAGEFVVDRWRQSRAQDDPLLFIEMIPFGETRNYVKRVWRNQAVYQFLGRPVSLVNQQD